MEVDFSVTNHPPEVVTLKKIQIFKQINTKVESVDCGRYELPEPGSTYEYLHPQRKNVLQNGLISSICKSFI